MEQRILQYRKSIDEWLEKTEQSAQVSQEILRDKMEEHLNQIGFFPARDSPRNPEKLNYSTSQHFTQAFRQHYGITANKYRRQLQDPMD